MGYYEPGSVVAAGSKGASKASTKSSVSAKTQASSGKKRLAKKAPGSDKDDEEKVQSGVRRKAKATEKKEAASMRVSNRLAAKDKVAYDEKAIDKLIDEAQGLKSGGSGCISVMLAHNYDPEKHDPTGWLMSEKLDGVRCYWNGKNMYTRNGNPFYAPDEFKAKLPKIALDGELWTNRDDFQKIVSIVRRQDKDSEEWKKIKFMVFDAPLVKGSFVKRIATAKAEIDKMSDSVCEVL